MDLDNTIWSYTPSQTENALGTQLVVPLSKQVLSLFKELKVISISKAFKNLAFNNGETTDDEFRAPARTLLNEVKSGTKKRLN